MNFFLESVQLIMNLGGSVMLPIMITILGLIFGIKFFESLRNGLMIGIGFIGINTVVSLLVTSFAPVTEYYSKMSSGFTVIDVGWEGIAALTWSTSFALIIVPLGMLLNYLLVKIRFTKTLNVDIWNYYHPILTGTISYYLLKNLGVASMTASIVGVVVGVAFTVVACKSGDFFAKRWQDYYGLPGTTCTTLDQTLTFWPISFIVCKIIDLIPGLNKIQIDINWVSEKFGSLGEPSVLAFIVGLGLSILTKQDLGSALTMSVGLAAAVVLMPKMVSMLMEGLVPIANAARVSMQKRLGSEYEVYIGMDEALGLGDECGLAVALIMIPITIALGFIIPGVNFFPVAMLGALVYLGSAAAMYANGNIFKTLMGTIAIVAFMLVTKSYMADIATNLALQVGTLENTGQMITGSSLNEIQCVLLGVVGKFLGAF
ncbi:PTS transporter subunit IIC [Anaerofustis stercorihominis]|uniref:PTS transporter subunit IIC n=1 Tax=Anaerofustis stercorihominis TaxID=214853 RepID=UPI003991FA06